MYTKKSLITDWWVARDDSKMAFVNIMDREQISGNLLVVGYLDKENEQLATSTNRVVRITEEGVFTEKGTFYPFEEAHQLYLSFLIEANKENTVIAKRWDYADIFSNSSIIADIVRNGHIEKDVTFDFNSSQRYGVMLEGYSKKLNSNVVLCTFSKRSFCLVIGISEDVEADIYRSSFATEEESRERVNKVKSIFEEKLKKLAFWK